MKKYIPILTIIFIQGCASVSMLPKSADELNFEAPEGKTGWSQYQQVEIFKGYEIDEIYSAAKAGLASAEFSLRKAEKEKGLVIGEHGITLHDWNIIAGVYFKKYSDNIKVKVIVEGSKDLGFSGDVTSDGWTGKIINGMRNYLSNHVKK